jgi:helix-turn-helix protein
MDHSAPILANAEVLPEILTAKELEAFLRIDVKTIYSYVQRGLIPHMRIESNLRFSKHPVLRWLEEAQRRQFQVRGDIIRTTPTVLFGVPGRQQDLVVLVPLDEQDTVPDLSAAGRIQAEPAIEGVTVEFRSSSQ